MCFFVHEFQRMYDMKRVLYKYGIIIIIIIIIIENNGLHLINNS